MSGGVDSSVAAALMKAEGHDVVGVTLKLWTGPNGEAPTAGCCTVSDAEDARRVAAQLDIPYYVLDYTEEFRNGVVDRFLADYGSGRTPNPCIECNRTVKFDRLLGSLQDFDTEVLVTGHHARNHRTGGSWRLLRGRDRAKDQSYVLSMLTQDQLSRVRLPVGELTKSEVRSLAAGIGLRTAAKPESMDICFVGKRDYRGFLRDAAPAVFTPGPVVGTDGVELGRHEGIAGFTVGQRRGLGVAVGEPVYVLEVDAPGNRVVVGPRELLSSTGLDADRASWVAGGPPSDGPFEATVRVRYRGDDVPAVIEATGAESFTVVFRSPQPAIAPGQSAVVYRDDEVLGGARIVSSFR
jgi:tRNA-specific 2-thiouridylase